MPEGFMDDARTAAARTRLARLDSYLQQDPGNAGLLADACDTAMACGDHECIQRYLAIAAAQALDPRAWGLRQARLHIARRELDQASTLIEALRAEHGDDAVLSHDLAYVRLLQENCEGCCALIAPWVQQLPPDAPEAEGMQTLWLRALHRLGRLQEAWDWALARESAGALRPAAKGVASLIAIDLEDFTGARGFSQAALTVGVAQPEALVAAACVALANGSTAQARSQLNAALAYNPADGRIWSALGMASLQAQEFDRAREELERALGTMPDHIGTWHALGWTHLLRADHPAARGAFEQALALDRGFAESQGAMGLLLALEGQPTQALHHLEAADRLDPRNLTARYARALVSGEVRDAQALQALAARLLDRPGFFGGKLSDALPRRGPRPH